MKIISQQNISADCESGWSLTRLSLGDAETQFDVVKKVRIALMVQQRLIEAIWTFEVV